MKILMLCDFYDETLEFQENLLTKYFTKQGHEVIVATSTYANVFDYYETRYDKTAPSRDYYENQTRIIKLPFKYPRLSKIRISPYISIKSILKEVQPDLIYVHGIVPNMLECRAYMKSQPSCRMIMDYHADYSNSGKNWLSLKILHGFIRKRLILDRMHSYLSKIFPVVPAGFTFLREVYGIDDKDMELLPLGADVDQADEIRGGNSRIQVRAALQIPEDDFVIFTGGKLAPRKKTELLIKAVKQINNPKVHLIIIGASSADNTSYGEGLKQLATDSDNIYFEGWQTSEAIYKYMAAADLAVFPASQSILWQRSMVMHLPLIVGDTGGQSIEYLNQNQSIIIINKDRINELVIKKEIDKILNNPLLLKKMTEGAELTKKESLDWNKLTKKLLRFNTTK